MMLSVCFRYSGTPRSYICNSCVVKVMCWYIEPCYGKEREIIYSINLHYELSALEKQITLYKVYKVGNTHKQACAHTHAQTHGIYATKVQCVFPQIWAYTHLAAVLTITFLRTEVQTIQTSSGFSEERILAMLSRLSNYISIKLRLTQ